MAESAPWEAESEQQAGHAHARPSAPPPPPAPAPAASTPRLDQFKVRVRKETPAQHSARKGPLVSKRDRDTPGLATSLVGRKCVPARDPAL